MIEAEKIYEVMGGKPLFHRRIRSVRELGAAVDRGLPKKALKNVVRRIYSKDQNNFIYKVVPEGTYKRRKTLLSVEESQKTERIARVIATAIHVWGDEEKARVFLTTPHPLFEERPPIFVALSELGARQIEEFLWQIYYGLPL